MSEEMADNAGNAEYEALIREAVGACSSGDWERAADLAGACLTLAPQRGEARALLGVVAFVADDYGRAVELLTSSHEINPDDREIADLTAQVHTRIGNLNDGVYFAKLATIGEANPLLEGLSAPGLTGLGVALNEAEVKTYLNEAHRALAERRYADVVELCQRELRLREGTAEVFTILGDGLMGLSDPIHALDAYRAAVHLDPEDARVRLGLVSCLSMLGNRDRARTAANNALSLVGDDTRLLTRAAAQCAILDPRDQRKDIEDRWPGGYRMGAKMVSKTGEQIKIGYLTDAACNVEEMRILESILIGHDRDSVRSIVFSADVPSDPTSARLKSYAYGWHDIGDLNDSTVVDWMGVNDLDALIDLTFSPEGQRPGVLMSNSAPRIIGMFGPRPGILGHGYDWVLCHRDADQAGKRKLAVDAPLLSVDPKTMPDVSDTCPAAENGYVTFGAFLDLRLLTPEVAALFASVLRGLPGSRLLLGNTAPVSDDVRNVALECFADNGVVDRVNFRPNETDPNKTLVVRRLDMMVRTDVYLETFPATPLLPAVDAIWSGVRVVAMDGDPMAGASTPGALRGAGLADWIASDDSDYVAKAVAAGEAAAKMASRKDVIEAHRATMLFDPKANAKAIETALREL